MTPFNDPMLICMLIITVGFGLAVGLGLVYTLRNSL